MNRRSLAIFTLLFSGVLAFSSMNTTPVWAQENNEIDTDVLLAPVSGSDDSEGARGLLTDSEDEDQIVTMIIQLEEESSSAWSGTKYSGMRSADRHNAIKDQIATDVTSSSNGARMEDLYDYSNVFDGFAIRAPKSLLYSIRSMPGVKTAFIEETFEKLDVEGIDNSIQPENISSLEMMNADLVSQKGDGQVIEVIDSALDTTHPAFSGDLDDDTLTLHRSDVQSLIPRLRSGRGGAWISEKIPFVYDYADGDSDVMGRSGIDLSHGTHVAGIATANGGDIRGTAPNAQLIMAKVSRDADGAMPDSAILAALDDAAVIRPDVINMSLGTDAGMSSARSNVYAYAYENIRSLGISLDIAAGNSYSSALGNRSGRNLPYASDPDSSVVAEPSTYKAALSIASVDNSIAQPVFQADALTVTYRPARSTGNAPIALFDALASGDYPYVDGGVGSTSDVRALSEENGGNLAGKIVLIRRGSDASGIPMTFEDKVAAVAPLNPAAVVLYDNVVSESLITPAITTATVPTVFISRANGEALLRSTQRVITFTQGGRRAASGTIYASNFSSWGVSPDLTLKPEIAAPGGNIYSALPGGGYGYQSGTSMASPQLAGISALVRQRIHSEALFTSMSEVEKNQVVTNLLMGTARPVVDPTTQGHTYYSPRKIGAGLTDAMAATNATVYASVEGAVDTSRPKAELGDGRNGWSFDITLRNLSDLPRTYTLDGQALSENVSDGFFTQHSSNWNGRGIALTYSQSNVEVPAHGSVTVTVNVTPDERFAAYVSANTPNGTFIDGYITFTSHTSGEPDQSVPFLGFYGDWGQAPVFDAQWSENEVTPSHMYRSALVNTSTGFPLGINPLDIRGDASQAPTPNASRYVISNASTRRAPRQIRPLTGTLRSVPAIHYSYTDERGRELASYSYEEARKSLFSVSGNSVRYVETTLGNPFFSVRDPWSNTRPEGAYTLTISADTDGPSSRTHQIAYRFTVDNSAPVVSNVQMVGEGDQRALSFDVADASPLAGFDLHSSAGAGWYYRQLVDDDGQVGADGLRHYHFEIPLTDINEAWANRGRGGSAPLSPILYVWDYGLNPSAASALDFSSPAPEPNVDPTPVRTGWVLEDGGWYYYDAQGKMTTGWVSVDGTWYYMDPGTGRMATGWLQDGAAWYYLQSSGAMATGWVSVGGTWYYMHSSGVMATGWLQIGGSWYYLQSSGAMATGWVSVGGTWYYMHSSGVMATGWLQIGGSWYYLQSSGAMATGWELIGGTWYQFASNGVWIR